MMVSVALILAGFIVGGLAQPAFPTMSITTTISVAILGYGIVGQQLLNPLQELTVTLEQRVKERTQELAETAARLGVVNVALARRNTQLETAARVAQEAAAIRDVGELLNQTVNLISDRFGFYHAGIFLLDEAREYAVLQAASSEGGRRMLARGRKIRVGQTGFVGFVAGTGQPRIAHNVKSSADGPPDPGSDQRKLPPDLSSYQASDTATFSTPELPSTRSEIAVPLKAHGQVIGVLDVQSTKPRQFSDDDVAALQVLADQVALAIENARLLGEAQGQLHEVDVLLGRLGKEGWQRLAAERPGWGYAYDGINVVRRAPDQILGTTEKMEPESQLTVPLQVRDAAIGHLNLDLSEQSLTTEAMDLARAIADQAGQALENARLFQEAQRTLQETEALYRAGQAIGAATSFGDVGQALIDYASVSGVDAARVLLFEHDERGSPIYMVMREGWAVDDRPAQPYGTRLSLDDYPLADLLNSNEPILVQDVLTDERANETTRTFVAATSGLRSLILVPISVGDRWIGLLSAGRNEPSAFTDGFVRGYETLTAQAAIALESIRLLEETQQRAERERLIGEITARMRETLDIDTVLQTAIREISQTLNISQVEVRIASGLTKIRDM
jgi:GAF domain-containing protein